jgi:hypothetical protein
MTWALSVERSLLKALDFRQHIFRLGFHLEIGKLAGLMVINAQFALKGIEHLQHPSQLMLGQQPNVQI